TCPSSFSPEYAGATSGDSRTGPKRSAPGIRSAGATFCSKPLRTLLPDGVAAACASPMAQPSRSNTGTASTARQARRLIPTTALCDHCACPKAEFSHPRFFVGAAMMRDPLLERNPELGPVDLRLLVGIANAIEREAVERYETLAR